MPFKWTDQCQKSLDYVKQITTTSPTLAYPDPEKQYYLFTDSSKHSMDEMLVQHDEQTKDNDTKLNIPHPITYQSGTFQGSQKNWSILSKEAYGIYISFQKMVFYLKDAHIMIWCDHTPLHKFIYSATKNDNINNWSQEIML